MPPPPPPAGGMPPMMPPGGGYQMTTPGNLASPGMRIVGGLIDGAIVFVIVVVAEVIFRGGHGIAGVADVVLGVLYFAYFWSSQGASIGMMPFGLKVRDMATGQYPTMGKAALRGLIWWFEFWFTFCLIGFIGWGWQLWDPQRQAIHDKVAGTIVTTN